MKLLLDENISRRIVVPLQPTYPGSTHVCLVGLESALDREIWTFAQTNNYVIVTKDVDFQDLLALAGHPPKVIRLLAGNCGNQEIVAALLNHFIAIEQTLAAPEIGIVHLF